MVRFTGPNFFHFSCSISMAGKWLFLSLRTFSATGGIERVCRILTHALSKVAPNASLKPSVTAWSMYDKTSDADTTYLNGVRFRGFNQMKVHFIMAALFAGWGAGVVVLSHVNLLLIGWLIKLVSPGTKLILLAHGIEVWGPLAFHKKRMLASCDEIWTVSQFTKDKLLEQLGYAGPVISVLNNCLDPFLPEPVLNETKIRQIQQQHGIQPDQPVLLTLTRMSAKELYKGYDHVLESIPALTRDFPGLRYMLVGKYDAQEKERLDRLIDQLNIRNQVIFTGYVPDEDLSAYYHMATCFVMPSKKEGFGIAFIEAMYYGLPVIAGNKDGSVDALLQGRLGVLVDPDRQQAIEDGIRNVLNNPAPFKPDHQILMAHFGFDYYQEQVARLLQKHKRS